MGGRGLDPAIRGQSQGRINVLVDGAYVFGACPNRMDPPSAFAAPYSWDQVLVLKGVQTLRWGGGGSGGTVIFQRETWPDERGVTGRAGLAASSNGTNQSLFGDLQFAGEKYYLRGRLFEEDAGDYEDGNGDSVRSAYEERGAAVETGLTVTGADRLEFSADVTRGKDIRYSGAGMDAPKDDLDAYRVKYMAQHIAEVGRAFRRTPGIGGQSAVAVLATLFTLVMSNVGATVLLVPLAVNIALGAGADPALFALTVAIATSNSFLIPTHQVNALIMGPAGYRVADFLRAGGIMTVLFLLVAVTVLNIVF